MLSMITLPNLEMAQLDLTQFQAKVVIASDCDSSFVGKQLP